VIGWVNETWGVALLVLGIIGLGVQGYRQFLYEKLLSLRDDVEKSKVAWGLWHTGGEIVSQNLIDTGNIKRILIPKSDKNNPALILQTKLSKQKDINHEIREIEELVKQAQQKKVPLRRYTQPTSYAFTIFDKPKRSEIDSEPSPCSKKAWIVVRVLEPEVGYDLRHKFVIKNKGKGRFQKFYNLYETIWNESESN